MPEPVPDPEAVAAALARLVNGTSSSAGTTPEPNPDCTPEPEPVERLVVDAEAALEALPTAAAFVDEGDEQRLRRAVEDSTDERLGERGREVLAALERLRTAAESGEPENRSQANGAAADHFHRGRTTLLSGDGVPPER